VAAVQESVEGLPVRRVAALYASILRSFRVDFALRSE
jgi:hypothetical protein